jgi:hypothetical protein
MNEGFIERCHFHRGLKNLKDLYKQKRKHARMKKPFIHSRNICSTGKRSQEIVSLRPAWAI